MPTELQKWLLLRVKDIDLTAMAESMLIDLAAIDTSVGEDIDRLRTNEARSWRAVERYATAATAGALTVTHLPIQAAVFSYPSFSHPSYALPESNGHRVDRAVCYSKVYRDRFNCLISSGNPVGGPAADHPSSRPDWLVCAHIDTVPPHLPPAKAANGIISGRGACDDKGPLVSAILAMKLLHEACEKGLVGHRPRIDWLFVIDEEVGGTGALSALSQLELTDVPVVVLEPTELRPYAGNRGALWFEVSCGAPPATSGALPLLLSQILVEIAETGRQLTIESKHPMFEAACVRPCIGVLGPYGHHPSSPLTLLGTKVHKEGGEANAGEVERVVRAALQQAEERGLLWAAKSPTTDPVQAQDHTTPRASHLTLRAQHGHMGSMERGSDAGLKLAVAIQALRERGYAVDLLDGHESVLIAGGQGFVPSHSLLEVERRLAAAVATAVGRAKEELGLARGALQADIQFKRLRNEAYASSQEARGPRVMAAAFAAITGNQVPPLCGWNASCDARLFAKYSSDVTTFGPGLLSVAHTDSEHIAVDEIVLGAAILAHGLCSNAQEKTGQRP